MILGKTWKVVFHAPNSYVKKVADDSKAEIDYDRRILEIDLNHLCDELVRHELTHAYAKERSIVETGIKGADQFEEFFCEIVGKHGKTIVDQADTLVEAGRSLWKKT